MVVVTSACDAIQLQLVHVLFTKTNKNVFNTIYLCERVMHFLLLPGRMNNTLVFSFRDPH